MRLALAGLLFLAPFGLTTSTPQTPTKVAPGEVSLADRHETFPVVDPVDGSFWFSVVEGSFAEQSILRAPRLESGWGPAETAPFSGRWGDRAPRFSPDGSRLYFTSNRPAPGRDSAGDMNIWVVERRPEGWSAPRLAAAPVNSAGNDIHASVTDRALYVASDRSPGQGRSDIYRIPSSDEGWGSAISLAFNDERSQPDLLVDVDERWMILVITDHPDGLGGDDLFVVLPDGGGWGEPRHLPSPINSPAYEYGPTLSPDGRWLYYTSHRDGTADVFRVPVSELELPAGP